MEQAIRSDGADATAAGGEAIQDFNLVSLAADAQEPRQSFQIGANQGDGFWSVARRVFQVTGVHSPSEQQVRTLAEEIARANDLAIDSRLSSGQVLTVPVPEGGRLPADSAAQRHQATVSNEDRPSCSSSWSEVEMIADWVTDNEAGWKTYTAFNEDDNGSGISVGLMQWNQKRGKLPHLLEAWHSTNPGKFDRMFGAYSDELLDTAWVKGADFVGNSALYRGMVTALADTEFQSVQLDLRNDHVEDACEVARDYRFTSLRGRAVVADLINQLGEYGTKRLLARVPHGDSESARIEQLKELTGGRINGFDRVSAIEEEVKEIWRKGSK